MAAVDGQRAECDRVELVGEVGTFRVDDGSFGGDDDGGRLAARAQFRRDLGQFADFDDHVFGPVGGEPGCADGDGVVAGHQARGAKVACGVAGDGGVGVSRRAVDENGCIGQGGAAVVDDGPGDGSIDGCLRKQGLAGGEERAKA